MPKKERCPGSGDPVDGPDEPDGTVGCRICGTSFLPMRTTVKDGKKWFSLPEHDRTVRTRPRKKGGPPNRRNSPRRSGRR